MAFYGKAEYIKVTSSGVKLDLNTQGQTISQISDLENYDLMSASADYNASQEEINLNFKHECAILKLNLAGISENYNAKKVKLGFSDTDNANFVTGINISKDGGNYTYEYGKNVTINFTEETIASEGKANYYCMLLTENVTDGSRLNIALEGNDTDYIYYGDKNIKSDLETGKFYSMPEATLSALDEISLSDKTIDFSSKRYWGTDYKSFVTDNNPDTSWASQWDTSQTASYNETFGVFIDITLGDAKPTEYLSFDYMPDRDTNIPSKIRIDAGTDKSSLQKLGEFDLEDGLVQTARTWFVGDAKSKLPILSLEGIDVQVVRISFLETYNKTTSTSSSLTDPWYAESGRSHPAMFISEIRLYGK